MRKEKASSKSDQAQQRTDETPARKDSRNVGGPEKQKEERRRTDGEEHHADVNPRRRCTGNHVGKRGQLVGIKRRVANCGQIDVQRGETKDDHDLPENGLDHPEEHCRHGQIPIERLEGYVEADGQQDGG